MALILVIGQPHCQLTIAERHTIVCTFQPKIPNFSPANFSPYKENFSLFIKRKRQLSNLFKPV